MAQKTRSNQGTKRVIVPVTNFKMDSEKGIFTCYANVKNHIDFAGDRSVDGCFVASCRKHTENGTMPKMFWMHNPHSIPVGVWSKMAENEIGLLMEGKNLPTTKGKDIQIAAEAGAIDSFSIGYNVIREEYNEKLDCWDLLEVEIIEVSWVTYGCNDKSTLIEMKSKLESKEVPTKRELEKHLRDSGLSRKEAATICSRYDDTKSKADEDQEDEDEVFDIFS